MVALVLTLAGCVTPQSMRARAPDFTATSQKSVHEIAGCIGSSWRGSALNSVPIEQGLSLVATLGDGEANVMIEIVDRDGGRKVSIYFRHYPISFQDTAGMTTRLQACV